MKAIVGLGNPGVLYARSRHNIGAVVIKALGKRYHCSLRRNTRIFAVSCILDMEGQQVVVAAPLTYMNRSGISVGALAAAYSLDIADLLVVCDDLDLELGRIKIRPYGSSGGHRGLSSIIEVLGQEKFSRLRIGIGRPSREKGEVSEYVLSGFPRSEQGLLEEAVAKAVDCCITWVTDGIDASMNRFNQKKNA